MKVLFISPRCPLPADTGGKIRTSNLIRQIAKRCETHVVSFSFDEKDALGGEELRKLGMKVTFVPAPRTGAVDKLISVLASPVPFSASKYHSSEMTAQLTAIMAQEKFDIVHFDHIHTTHYRPLFGQTPCLVDEHNVEYMILQRCAKVEKNFVKRLGYAQQTGKMKRFEAGQLAGFEACSAVSEDDAKVLSELCNGAVPVHVVPNGVDTDFFQSRLPLGGEEDALVFTGSMDWLPNQDAMVFFIADVLPLLRAKRPQLKLYIVGKDPSPELRALAAGDPLIELTGRVDDVRPYMEKAKVFICPLRIGGGTRLKILEALSMQKAVVSTTIGAEGIAYTAGQDLCLADTPEETCARILGLLDDPVKRRGMGEAGRRLVLGTYDWRIVGQSLLNIYERMRHGRA